ncbi:hypothetical protein [Vibrio harveyi]|uniref:hypothetical protein n=1 Tax=Vibrio harveyi TaxID=669 RepID=UPI00217DDCCA|nr:hypothetical protein [Vibrio harveyi]
MKTNFIEADKEVVEAQEKTERDQKQFHEDLVSILKLPHGRNVLWTFMDKFGVFRETFCGESTNSSSYNQGRSSCGREMMNDILSADPKSYVEMLNEKIEESKK